ncbi:MAG: hypothetical protein K2G77_07910 [Muribaculaceae bacterium]|nr:hypothetical protein [Muribaculaceae bacterium]
MKNKNPKDAPNGAVNTQSTTKTQDATKNPRITRNLINVPTLTSVVFIVFCYFMLALRNGYMLRWYEEMSLFEGTRFFFRQCLYYPGGLFRYAGAWLTQLMYYPVLGSVVLIVLWSVMAWLTQKVFRLSRAAFPLVFIVPLSMLVSIVQMDDAWLSMKSVGYMYSNTLGYLFVVGALWLYRIVEKNLPLAFPVLLLMALCYFFAGFFALFAAFIGIIFMGANSIRNKKYIGLVFAGIAAILILVLPNLYYMYYQPTTVDNDYLYLRGLPDLLMESFDIYLWVPFIVATAFLLILASVSAVVRFPSARWMMWVSVAAMSACGIWCLRADKKNEQLRATVVMLRHMENNDWGGMAMVMSRIKEPPSYIMRLLYNFAIVNLGGKREDLKDMKPRNIDPRHAEGFNMTAYINIPINYYNGDFTLSYRWGMEHCVQYGKRVFFLKYMVKNAILNGELKLAKRYNDILMGTLFHRKWAEEMNRYIEDPSLIDSNIEFKSILEYANPVDDK